MNKLLIYCNVGKIGKRCEFHQSSHMKEAFEFTNDLSLNLYFINISMLNIKHYFELKVHQNFTQCALPLVTERLAQKQLVNQ